MPQTHTPKAPEEAHGLAAKAGKHLRGQSAAPFDSEPTNLPPVTPAHSVTVPYYIEQVPVTQVLINYTYKLVEVIIYIGISANLGRELLFNERGTTTGRRPLIRQEQASHEDQ